LAHSLVSMPPLVVEMHHPSGKVLEPISIKLVRPEFWAESQTFLALVNDSLATDRVAYESLTVTVKDANAVRASFEKEERYIGFPVVIVPLGPSKEATQDRTLFLRLGSDDSVFRITISGTTAVVKATSTTEARRRLPSELRGIRPTPTNPNWRSWHDAETSFYKSTSWVESDQITVFGLERNQGSDKLLLNIRSNANG